MKQQRQQRGIKKTVVTSTINAVQTVIVDGEPKLKTLEPINVLGGVTEAKALKLLKDNYKLNNVTIVSITTDTNTYELDLETFVKTAKIVKEDN